MTRIIRSPLAERDIIEIVSYTKSYWDEDQASRYADLVEQAEVAIAKDPTRGRPFSSRRPGIFIYPVRHSSKTARHVIFYRISAPDTVTILRVLHDAMDFARHVP